MLFSFSMLYMHPDFHPCFVCTLIFTHALYAPWFSPMPCMHPDFHPCFICTLIFTHALYAPWFSPMLYMHPDFHPCFICTLIFTHDLYAPWFSPMLYMHPDFHPPYLPYPGALCGLMTETPWTWRLVTSCWSSVCHWGRVWWSWPRTGTSSSASYFSSSRNHTWWRRTRGVLAGGWRENMIMWCQARAGLRKKLYTYTLELYNICLWMF